MGGIDPKRFCEGVCIVGWDRFGVSHLPRQLRGFLEEGLVGVLLWECGGGRGRDFGFHFVFCVNPGNSGVWIN